MQWIGVEMLDYPSEIIPAADAVIGCSLGKARSRSRSARPDSIDRSGPSEKVPQRKEESIIGPDQLHRKIESEMITGATVRKGSFAFHQARDVPGIQSRNDHKANSTQESVLSRTFPRGTYRHDPALPDAVTLSAIQEKERAWAL
jgi:hypothetical protein